MAAKRSWIPAVAAMSGCIAGQVATWVTRCAASLSQISVTCTLVPDHPNCRFRLQCISGS